MHGRRKGAIALGTLIAVPLASAEAAEAMLPAESGGAPTTKPSTAPPADPPVGKRPPPRPANPTVAAERPPPATSYGDEHRQPRPEPKPVAKPEPVRPTAYSGHPTRRVEVDPPAPKVTRPDPRPAEPKPVARPEPVKPTARPEPVQPTARPEPVQPTARPEPANPTIYTGHPTRRVEVDAPASKTAPPEPRPPTPTVSAEQPPTTSYGDERRQPHPEPVRPEPKPANPTIEVSPPKIGVQSRPPDLPRSADAAERWLHGGNVPRPAEPEPAPEIPASAKAVDDDDGGFSIGVEVNLPGERFDVGAKKEIDLPDDPREAVADTIGPVAGFGVNPVGSLLKLRDQVRSQLPEKVQPFTLSPTEALAIGGEKLADQIPEGPEEPSLEDGPRALLGGYLRNSTRDGIRTLTGLPQGLVNMPKDIDTDVSNATEDLFRHVTDLPAREGSERQPGETGLEHYTRNHPFTGGFGNLGVNMYDRYYPFVAARYGNYDPLREDMTDPETGKMRAPTLVRDYYRAPSSSLLEDLTIPSLLLPIKVPVRVPVRAPLKPPVRIPPRVAEPRAPRAIPHPDAEVPAVPRDVTPDAPRPDGLPETGPDALPDRTAPPKPVAPPRTPAEKYRERVPKLADDPATGRVVDEQLGHAGSGTRANTPRPKQFQPTRTGGGASELQTYHALERVPDVERIQLVEHASGARSADSILTMRGADGTTYRSRFEVTTATTGRGSGYRPTGVGRAPQVSLRRVRDAIDRKTGTRNQFQEPMAGVGPGGFLGIHLRGKPLSIAELQKVVTSRTARLQGAAVRQVWFFLSDRTLVRFDVGTGTHTVVRP